jgi:hypothetical protein
MSSRLDELFDPDRLRRNWEPPPAPAADPLPPGPNPAVHAQYRELLGLLEARYPGAPALRAPLAELSGLIGQAFPEDAAGETASAAQREEIAARLESLEEILWALDLSGVSR